MSSVLFYIFYSTTFKRKVCNLRSKGSYTAYKLFSGKIQIKDKQLCLYLFKQDLSRLSRSLFLQRWVKFREIKVVWTSTRSFEHQKGRLNINKVVWTSTRSFEQQGRCLKFPSWKWYHHFSVVLMLLHTNKLLKTYISDYTYLIHNNLVQSQVKNDIQLLGRKRQGKSSHWFGARLLGFPGYKSTNMLSTENVREQTSSDIINIDVQTSLSSLQFLMFLWKRTLYGLRWAMDLNNPCCPSGWKKNIPLSLPMRDSINPYLKNNATENSFSLL